MVVHTQIQYEVWLLLCRLPSFACIMCSSVPMLYKSCRLVSQVTDRVEVSDYPHPAPYGMKFQNQEYTCLLSKMVFFTQRIQLTETGL